MVAATVKNAIDRDVTAVVAAAFHAADGTILARPFTIVSLAPGTSRPVRFEGPKEATRAEVFVLPPTWRSTSLVRSLAV